AQSEEPAGTALDFEDESALAARFPRLWERFGTG
ncbi:polymerase, partial [Streptomyces violascens]